jgi:hypothetical protein
MRAPGRCRLAMPDEVDHPNALAGSLSHCVT